MVVFWGGGAGDGLGKLGGFIKFSKKNLVNKKIRIKLNFD